MNSPHGNPAGGGFYATLHWGGILFGVLVIALDVVIVVAIIFATARSLPNHDEFLARCERMGGVIVARAHGRVCVSPLALERL